MQPSSTPGCFSESTVGPCRHTQVPLGVRVQLRVQGPALWDAASYNQHGILVILQPGLRVSLRHSVLYLPRQCQLQLFPKIGRRCLGARVGSSARVNTQGVQTLVAPSHLAERFTGSQNLKGSPSFRHQTTEPPPTPEPAPPSAPRSRASSAAGSPGGGADAAGAAQGARGRAAGPRR